MKIKEEVLERMKAHAERSFPEECCGVMLGTGIDEEPETHEIIEIDNSQGENRKRRFLITPEQYRQAERDATERNMTLLGFYHSHPDHPAAPSAFDTEHALPWLTYIIVAVTRQSAGDVTAWLLTQDRGQFERQTLSVLPAPARAAAKNVNA